jgi:hypothetical protein
VGFKLAEGKGLREGRDSKEHKSNSGARGKPRCPELCGSCHLLEFAFKLINEDVLVRWFKRG